MSTNVNRKKDLLLIDQVDALNEEVKALALNLAIYLAKAKGSSERLQQLEPDFMRLVNGTVKVVQELTLIIDSARDHKQTIADFPTGITQTDEIEIKLRSILEQCSKIMNALSRTGHLSR